MPSKIIIMSFLILLMTFVSPAKAQRLHYTEGDWKVFTHDGGREKTCYIGTVPTAKKGNYTRRGDPFLLVTHRKASVDEVNVSSGYPYKKGSDAAVTVDGKRFNMFTQGERAWAYDEAQDNSMVGAMIKGNRMTVKGTSQKGTYSVDTYSLKGFSRAHQKMKALCR